MRRLPLLLTILGAAAAAMLCAFVNPSGVGPVAGIGPASFGVSQSDTNAVHVPPEEPEEPAPPEWLAFDAGGGGWLHSGAFSLSDPDEIMIGADVNGAWITYDAGQSWVPANAGFSSYSSDATAFYVDEIVAIPGGFVAATHQGMFRWTDADSSWSPMGEKLSWIRDYSWGDVEQPIPFSSVCWDGNNKLFAGAGRTRSGSETSEDFGSAIYPSAFISAEANGDPVGAASVWCYDLSEEDGLWRPWVPASTDTLQIGGVRDVAVTYTALGDTIVAVCSGSALAVFTGSDWVDAEADWDWRPSCTGFSGTMSASFAADGTGFSPWTVSLAARTVVVGEDEFEWVSLYAGMAQDSGDVVRLRAGVYYNSDVVASTEIKRVIGSTVNLSPYTTRMDTCYYGAVMGSGATVHNGRVDARWAELLPAAVGVSVDTLIVGGRNGYVGLHKIIYDYQTATVASATALQRSTSTDNDVGFDDGWLNTWGSSNIMPPVICSTNHGRILTHTNARLELTTNGGSTFSGVWTDSLLVGDETYWTGRGWNEMAVNAVASLPTGEIVMGCADTGLFISNTAHTGWQWHRVPVESVTSGADTLNTSGYAWSLDCRDLAVIDDWQETGRPAIIAIMGSISTKPTKVMMLHDSDDDGDWDWSDVSRGTMGVGPGDETYRRFSKLAIGGDGTVYAAFTRYDGIVGDDGASQVACGVDRFVYDYGWTWADHEDVATQIPNTGLIGDIVWSKTANDLFLGLKYSGTTGGIYRCALPDSVWSLAYGGNTIDFLDIQCLATTPGGSVVYAGNRGRSGGGFATVLRCDNPQSAATAWVPMFNNDNRDNIEWGITTYSDGWTVPDSLSAARLFATVSSIAVAEWDSTEVLFSVNASGICAGNGLYRIKRSHVEKLSDGPVEGYGGTYLYTYDGAAYIGTNGGGLWRRLNDQPAVPEFTETILAIGDPYSSGTLYNPTGMTPTRTVVADSTKWRHAFVDYTYGTPGPRDSLYQAAYPMVIQQITHPAYTQRTNQRWWMTWWDLSEVPDSSQVISAKINFDVYYALGSHAYNQFEGAYAVLDTLSSDRRWIQSSAAQSLVRHRYSNTSWLYIDRLLDTAWSPTLVNRNNVSTWGIVSPLAHDVTGVTNVFASGDDFVIDVTSLLQYWVDHRTPLNLRQAGFLICGYDSDGGAGGSYFQVRTGIAFTYETLSPSLIVKYRVQD